MGLGKIQEFGLSTFGSTETHLYMYWTGVYVLSFMASWEKKESRHQDTEAENSGWRSFLFLLWRLLTVFLSAFTLKLVIMTQILLSSISLFVSTSLELWQPEAASIQIHISWTPFLPEHTMWLDIRKETMDRASNAKTETWIPISVWRGTDRCAGFEADTDGNLLESHCGLSWIPSRRDVGD